MLGGSVSPVVVVRDVTERTCWGACYGHSGE